jgi:hypothetical protein
MVNLSTLIESGELYTCIPSETKQKRPPKTGAF